MATFFHFIGLSARIAIAYAITFISVNFAVAQENTKAVDGGKVLVSQMVDVSAIKALVAEKSGKTAVNPAQTFVYRWYALYSTTSSNLNDQELMEGGPISAPPASGGDCARDNNAGNYCAVLLEFPPGTTSFPSFDDETTVADAIAGSSAIRVATNVPAEDTNEDGYARDPF